MSSQPKKLPAMNEWQIQEIHNAIAEAEARDFATDAEVKAVMDKWNAHTK
jgi:predicted transcriptional regulator